jgi:hypothetical protein
VVPNRDLIEGEVRDDSPIAKAVANEIFQLYSNFLLEEARKPWSKILPEQADQLQSVEGLEGCSTQ